MFQLTLGRCVPAILYLWMFCGSLARWGVGSPPAHTRDRGCRAGHHQITSDMLHTRQQHTSTAHRRLQGKGTKRSVTQTADARARASCPPIIHHSCRRSKKRPDPEQMRPLTEARACMYCRGQRAHRVPRPKPGRAVCMHISAPLTHTHTARLPSTLWYTCCRSPSSPFPSSY
jgi:hypothetical protein